MPRARERVKVAARARLSPATMMRAALSPDLFTSASVEADLAPAPLSLLLLGAVEVEAGSVVVGVVGLVGSRLLQLRIDTSTYMYRYT